MYDVVIIGSGAAGLTTALNIDSNLKVLILTASINAGANTKLAQGGIAASWQASDEDKQLHILDTYKAGCFINDNKAVEQLIDNSHEAIDFLIKIGTNFDCNQTGYDLTAEGAHSIRRIFHADGDSTGRVIYESLMSEVMERSNITIIDQANVTTSSQVSIGTYQISYEHDRKQFSINTNNLVIACGGYGNLFIATTSTKYINGCSLMLAKQLDLDVSNLHLVQFHPTGFRANDGKYHLLTESLRGEGARFYSPQSGYFMSAYHNLGDIAPRDVTSRAVHCELSKGNQVYLDCRPVAKVTDIHRRFQTVSKVVVESGYNLATDLIPICPVAHYSIGGINVDLNGQTSKPGVYAVGEAAMSGVHGANRLASNSLLECIVYGIKVGKQIIPNNSFPINEVQQENQLINKNELITVQRVLSNCCNIVRNNIGLETGYKQLTGSALITDVARDIIKACIDNPSVGCHYKESCE